ncbi:phenylalanine--tRNA ligase subunit beta [Endothiovibrio diazotrophicus]
MKFSEKWLREWVDPQVSSEELAEQLTMAGLEVDSVEPAAAAFSKVVVGHVLAVEKHPDADKLNVCKVDVGEGEPLQIVCGAANVHVGMKAPTALVGAVLPGDFKIKKSKLRGVPSHGMLCSAVEIGMAESADGLLPLAEDAEVGRDVRDHFDLDDTIIEVDLTPNRGDCLGMAGIAREVGVLNSCPVVAPSIPEIGAAIDDSFPVAVEVPADCPRYVGRVVRGLDPMAQTPPWMVERLRRGGIRSLGLLVDVTNYVLLELGQPMHAFDLRRLDGGIRVRRAVAGEHLTLLDGKEIELDEETLVIADEAKVLALAGIMGGEASGVADDTDTIFLESAFFAPEVIAGRARRYGLATDSSYRFERGVDPQLQRRAAERATGLLLAIAGGEAGPLVEVCSEVHLPAKAPVVLRRERIRRLLGIVLEDDRVVEILERAGMTVEAVDGGWRVVPPSFRFDITIEADLIEELGRIHGYNNIPAHYPEGAQRILPLAEGETGLARLRAVLVDRGYQEAITYSFVDPEIQALLDPQGEGVRLANPISSDLSVMRTTLWPGLVKALQYNVARQQERVRLFETGLSFVKQGDEIIQEKYLSGVLCGGVEPEQWGLPSRTVDFFDAKGDVEVLLSLGGGGERFRFVPENHPALHPGQSARVLCGDEAVGWVGALHPSLEQRIDLPGRCYLFEISLKYVVEGGVPEFRPLSKFPAIRRDLAVVVDEATAAGEIRAAVLDAAGPLLESLVLFDVYQGKGVESGRKSLALGLILQDSSRTLTDDDVEGVTRAVVAVLEEKFGASLRD